MTPWPSSQRCTGLHSTHRSPSHFSSRAQAVRSRAPDLRRIAVVSDRDRAALAGRQAREAPSRAWTRGLIGLPLVECFLLLMTQSVPWCVSSCGSARRNDQGRPERLLTKARGPGQPPRYSPPASRAVHRAESPRPVRHRGTWRRRRLHHQDHRSGGRCCSAGSVAPG
jgi:hypothetical protein